MNARKSQRKDLTVRVKSRCSWCRQELEYPLRFTALIYCPNKNVRAHDVPPHLDRIALIDRHQLVAAGADDRAQPKTGLLSRIAAAAASALHIFRASR